jgi:hypothetical protein
LSFPSLLLDLILFCEITNIWPPSLAHSCLCRVKNMLAGQWQPPKKSQVLLYLTDFLGGCPCPASIFLTLHKCLWLASTIIQLFIFSECTVHHRLVRDSSAFRQLFFRLAGTSESSTYGKQRIYPCNSALAHFHVSWLSDFIFYPKPLYKWLHQSFFYSFITILPSESGVTLHYSTILP